MTYQPQRYRFFVVFTLVSALTSLLSSDAGRGEGRPGEDRGRIERDVGGARGGRGDADDAEDPGAGEVVGAEVAPPEHELAPEELADDDA